MAQAAPALAVDVAPAKAAEPAKPDYAIPDLVALTKLIPSLHTQYGSIELGHELIGDYTAFRQDDVSILQVGQQQDQFEVRSASINVTGQLGPKPWITYKIGLEYNGFNVNADQSWNVTDLALNLDLNNGRTLVKVGQIKGNFSYEVVGSFVKMPQNERTMSPFAAPRNPGVMVVHAFGSAQRVTGSLAVYKDQAESAGGSFGFAARGTALVWGAPGNGNGYLHLGASLLNSGSDTAARYRARPGSNVADYYVDTGDFAVNKADHLGLEALYSNVGGWSVQSEYVVARVETVDFGTVNLRGFYVLGSWVMTGEFRPYNRRLGVSGRLEPKGRWGAPELFARYSMVDLDDGPIQGGRYDRIELGLNWWATTQWKLGIVAGRIWLDRFGNTGTTDTVLTRVQWVY
ncbi:MAG: OprO/OprP family phosphate-selective porin [Polymorphobacter sp.]